MPGSELGRKTDSQESLCRVIGRRKPVEGRNERVIPTNGFQARAGDFAKRAGDEGICRKRRLVVCVTRRCGAALRAGSLGASNHTDVRTAAARHGSAFLVCWKCEVEELNRISTSMPRKQPAEWDSFGNTQSRAEIRTPVQPWNAI